jgi:hypothetical protein
MTNDSTFEKHCKRQERASKQHMITVFRIEGKISTANIRAILDKVVAQVVKKCPSFSGTRKLTI